MRKAESLGRIASKELRTVMTSAESNTNHEVGSSPKHALVRYIVDSVAWADLHVVSLAERRA